MKKAKEFILKMEAAAAMRVCCPSSPPEPALCLPTRSDNAAGVNSTTSTTSPPVVPTATASYPGAPLTPQPASASACDNEPPVFPTRPRLHSLPVCLQYPADTPDVNASLPVATRRASDWFSDASATVDATAAASDEDEDDVVVPSPRWLNRFASDIGRSGRGGRVTEQGLLCPPTLLSTGASLGSSPVDPLSLSSSSSSSSPPAAAGNRSDLPAATAAVAPLPKAQTAPAVTVAGESARYNNNDERAGDSGNCEPSRRSAGTPPPEKLLLPQQQGSGTSSGSQSSSVQQQQHPLIAQNHLHQSGGGGGGGGVNNHHLHQSRQSQPPSNNSNRHQQQQHHHQHQEQDQPLQQRPHPELQQDHQTTVVALRRLSSHKSASYPTEQTSEVLSERAVQATHTEHQHRDLCRQSSAERSAGSSVTCAATTTQTPASRRHDDSTSETGKSSSRRNSGGGSGHRPGGGPGQEAVTGPLIGSTAATNAITVTPSPTQKGAVITGQGQRQQQQSLTTSGSSHQVHHHQQQQQHSYRSTFKPEWTLKWPYIVRSASGDPHVFFCEICKKTVSCAHQGLRDVTRHLESSGHHKMNLMMSLPTMATDHPDLLSASLSLQALRDSGELSVVTTPPHENDSDDQGSDAASKGPRASSSPVARASLQATQALATANGQLNPALKDVQCPVCFKVFSRKFSLEMHLLIHQGLKPYSCQNCGRSFRQKGTLMRHKAIHSKTPSFRCGLCQRSYRQKNVFLHHLRKRHNISTDMLDRRRSKSGGQDDGMVGTGSPNSFLDRSGSPGGAAETVYPPPELGSPGGAQQTRPVSTEPVTSTPPGLAGLPVFSSSSQLPLPSVSSRLQNPLFLPSLFNSPLMQTSLGFPTQQQQQPPPPLPPASMSPQSSWHCPFCPYETLNDDTDGCRKHLLHHMQETPLSCVACGKRCFNEKELIVHLQDEHSPATNGVGLGSFATLQAAINSCYRSAVPEPGDEQSEPLSLSRVVKEEPLPLPLLLNGRSKEMAFTCIPCKVDFSAEDELEHHIKSHHHVQQSGAIDDSPSSSAATEIGAGVQGPEDLSANSSRKRSFDSSCDSSSDSVPPHKPQTIQRSDDSDSCDPGHQHHQHHHHEHHHHHHRSTKDGANGGEADVGRLPKRQFLCVDCNKVFNSKQVYRYHVQMHISVAKSFRCGVCKIGFAKKHDLLQHTRQTHMKKFACAKCHKLFSYRSIYQRHVQDCDGQVCCRVDEVIPHRGRTRSFDEGQSQKAGSLPLIDVSLASSALGCDLIGVIPLLGDENQQGCPKQNVLLGVPVINPSVLQTHQQLIQNLLVVRNVA